MQCVVDTYKNKKVLITGGLGMIGSALANVLVAGGADVTLFDLCNEPYGANDFNIQAIKDAVSIVTGDIRDKNAIKDLVPNKDYIFNLAAQVSHNDSIDSPFLDAEINYFGHLNVLENVRRYNPTAVIVYSGSRLQYGRIEKIPVDEMHPLRPETPYALNKTAAENMYHFYHTMYGISCVMFRISNPYGPRSQMKHNKYTIVNWFIRQAIENETIRIFGDGTQIRDYIYIDDLVEAMLCAAANENCFGEVFNVGSGIGSSFKDMVKTIVETVGTGAIENVAWPENYINVETGDYVACIKKLRETTGWAPRFDLKDGISRTFDYYKEYKKYYW